MRNADACVGQPHNEEGLFALLPSRPSVKSAPFVSFVAFCSKCMATRFPTAFRRVRTDSTEANEGNEEPSSLCFLRCLGRVSLWTFVGIGLGCSPNAVSESVCSSSSEWIAGWATPAVGEGEKDYAGRAMKWSWRWTARASVCASTRSRPIRRPKRRAADGHRKSGLAPLTLWPERPAISDRMGWLLTDQVEELVPGAIVTSTARSCFGAGNPGHSK
jgi:hypothetical protein